MGYSLEIGNEDNSKESEIIEPVGESVSFFGEKIVLNLNHKYGTLFVRLYENRNQDDGVKKIIVAQRSLDPCASWN